MLTPTFVSATTRPDPVTDHLGSSTSIALLGPCTRIYPVTCAYVDVIPSVPLKRPEAGETRYFVYHNFNTLAIGGSVVENSSCGGDFCDRQVPISNTQERVSCGCFHTRDRFKIVTEHSVRIPCEPSVDPSGRLTVHKFRSARFDRLLFKKDSHRVFDSSIEIGDPIANKILREHIAKLVALVNEGHGWTIVGWLRTGKVKDSSEEGNRDAIDIASETVSPHISYLQPSDAGDVDATKVEEYRKLLITEDLFRKEMKEERERRKKEQEDRKRKASS